MKIINLGRGQGKTTRLLYASEFNDTPILCANMKHKEDSATNINTSKYEVDLLTIDDSDLFKEFFEKSSKIYE